MLFFVGVCILMRSLLKLATEPLQQTAIHHSNFIRVVVIFLLLMSGDIETNPGPLGECTLIYISVLQTEIH